MDYTILEQPKFRNLGEQEYLIYGREKLSKLNSSGYEIAKAICDSGSAVLDDVVKQMSTEYEVAPSLIAGDCTRIANLLEYLGVLKPASADAVRTGAGEATPSTTAGAWIGSLPVPLYVAWHLTSDCNLACAHCYSRGREGGMTLEQATSCLEKMDRAGVVEIAFGGGECFLHPDFLDIVAEANRRDMRVSVTTHGGAFSKSIRERLSTAGFSSIGVSFDSSDEAKHDAIRGAGSFKKAVAALKTIHEAGIRSEIVTVITRENVDEVEELARLAASLGVSKVHYKDFKVHGNGELNKDRFVLKLDEKIAAWKRIAEFSARVPDVELDFGATSEPEANFYMGDKTVNRCSCGSMSACLREDGRITSCSYSETSLGNLLADELDDIWMRSKRQRGFDFDKPSSCTKIPKVKTELQA